MVSMKKFFKKHDFEEIFHLKSHDFEKKKFALKFSRFDSIYPVKCANFAFDAQF